MRFGSRVPGFVDELPVTLLVKVLSPDVGELVLRLDVVNDDRAVLDQRFDEKAPQHDVLCPRGVVGAIVGHMKRRIVVFLERNTAQFILES